MSSHGHSHGDGDSHSHSHSHSDVHEDVHVHEDEDEDEDENVHEDKDVHGHSLLAGRVLFIDTFSGISGDMLVGALLDLGVPMSAIEGPVASLGLAGYALRVSQLTRSGIVARKFDVDVAEGQPMRTWRAIRTMLETAALAPTTRARALAAFSRLAEAEAAVHAVPVDDVHFHEVGAVDSIVDIVAACAAIDHLAPDEIVCTPLPMARGFVHAQHGPLPLPAPATVSCLRGVPTIATHGDTELVTPTGACLVAALATRFATWPSFAPDRVGWGAGTRDLADRPNLLRLVLGAPALPHGRSASGDLVLLETNVDDMTGEVGANAIEKLFALGALDAWTTPIGMKKGRAATLISVLGTVETEVALTAGLLRETTSLGVRRQHCERTVRPRRIVTVMTAYGAIDVKVADRDGLPRTISPEFESCRQAANAHAVPLRSVYEAAIAAAVSSTIS